MKAITLQSRIIILLTVFTILTIAIFVAVQLSHELDMINKYNQNQANVMTLVIENTWERILSISTSPQQRMDLLEKKARSLQESGTIQKAYLLDSNAGIVFSTDQGDFMADHSDFDAADKLRMGLSPKEEAVVDKKEKSFSVYMPLVVDNRPQYLLRVFFSLGDIWAAFNRVYGPAITIGILFVLVNIALGFSLSHLVIGPIKVFNQAAKQIAAGRLDLKVDIATNDELEELGNTFNYMSKELAKMKARAENANPLTKLPGNVMIQEEVERRIAANEKFTVIYCDLDNFKAFNDKYGVHKGDDAITLTGDLFKEAVQKAGQKGDFIGHEGGDDFLLVTVPERAQKIADYITAEFDKRVRQFYDQEDLERGHIVAHARDGSIKQFPIMTISLAGITNELHPIKSYGEVTNIAAGVKKMAKKKEGSCFVLDRRAEETHE